jgi:hypothetical protein
MVVKTILGGLYMAFGLTYPAQDALSTYLSELLCIDKAEIDVALSKITNMQVKIIAKNDIKGS